LRGLSLLYRPFTDFTLYGLSLFAVFYGLDWIATVPPTVKLTADRFGPEKARMVFGWVFAGHQIGAASAAFGAGRGRTEYSTYLPAFFVAGALCLFAAVLVLTLKKPSAPGFSVALPATAPRITACGAIDCQRSLMDSSDPRPSHNPLSRHRRLQLSTSAFRHFVTTGFYRSLPEPRRRGP
jgi:hypothetical protein